MNVFSELGLTKYESLVYESLISYGRISASEISDFSKVPPTAVYPALKQLIQKGLVLRFGGDVATFEAMNVKKAMGEFLRRKKERLDEVGERIVKMSEEKKFISSRRKVVEFGAGDEFSKEVYFDVFDSASKFIFILGWRMEKIGDKYDMLKRFQKCLKRGVEVRIIAVGDKSKKALGLIRDYEKAGIRIRFLPLEDFSILLKDGDFCKITMKKFGEEKVSINILDDNLARAMRQYYLDSWKRSEEIV